MGTGLKASKKFVVHFLARSKARNAAKTACGLSAFKVKQLHKTSNKAKVTCLRCKAIYDPEVSGLYNYHCAGEKDE